MEQLVEVARRLRTDHGFGGYIHLKTIPNASPDLILEAGHWADRLSINVELPRQRDLDALAPDKELVQIRRSMDLVRDGIAEARSGAKGSHTAAPTFAPAGQATQMIVGATDASDAVILDATATLYRSQQIRRVYFSAFSPIPDASPDLPSAAPPLLREHRLYQADWLMRFYGYGAGELANETAPQLELRVDPKLAWALRNPERFPIDVNRADREDLLRIPGVGVRSVDRIIAARGWTRLRLDDLRRLRVALHRARPFVVLPDHVPTGPVFDAAALGARLTRASQLELFSAAPSARHGEL